MSAWTRTSSPLHAYSAAAARVGFSFVVCCVVASALLLQGAEGQQELPPPCDSEIFCHGELLHHVQLAGLYPDSKTFVDKPLKNSPDEVLHNFGVLMNDTNGEPTKQQLKTFVDENFEEEGSELIPHSPEDAVKNPAFLEGIVDPELQTWAKKLVDLWGAKLCFKVDSRVRDHPDKFSQIYLKEPFVLPGGRFREIYYWDSYWTMDGLLLSGMNLTSKGMLQNFLDLVSNYGMVPNGGRSYYTRRSQPPYLIPMFKLYLDWTDDLDFLRENIDLLEEEFLFWHNNRSVSVTLQGKKVHVAQYRVNVGGPRPESYREDYELAESLPAQEEEDLYVQLKSGAESGWDYSTRWFVNNNTNEGSLKDLNVTSILPVDLNSLLCMNARILSGFYRRLGKQSKSMEYSNLADTKNETMALFWDDEDGTWYDFDLNTQQRRRYFYLSNIHPIWSECYGHEKDRVRAHTIDKVIQYLKKVNVTTNYVGGVPTSLSDSGQQWDFPNAWAPLQHLIIMGLYKARNIHHDADRLAYDLAQKWIHTNFMAYDSSDPHAMYEKYNVNEQGSSGGGGEYTVQDGFGWTNGVAMRLMEVFGDRLTAMPCSGLRLSSSTLPLVLLPSLVLALSGLFAQKL
ncbi:trehalase-like [Oratosquilla oratoria]|uniref:trehalase-like n=1 Tax=Oratosquilla oratoria TaxID=337810 RepID=UPI003F777DD2